MGGRLSSRDAKCFVRANLYDAKIPFVHKQDNVKPETSKVAIDTTGFTEEPCCCCCCCCCLLDPRFFFPLPFCVVAAAETSAPPPPPPPPPPVKSTIKFTPPEIKKDEDVTEPPPTQVELEKVDAGTATVVGDPEAKEVLLEEPGTGGDGEILLEAEINPEFPGGEEKMNEYLSSAVDYPPMAKENNIEGRVVLRFAVMADGRIDNIQVLNKPALGWGCEAAVEKAVKGMPKWSPGRQAGRAVPVYFTLPFVFKLDQ